MADQPLAIFDASESSIRTAREGDVAVAPATRITGNFENGSPEPFASVLNATNIDADFALQDRPLFMRWEPLTVAGEVDVRENTGILYEAIRSETEVRVRPTDPEYVDVFGLTSRVTRNVKDDTDLGNANIWMTAGYFAAQQDAEVSTRTDSATAVKSFLKMENGSVGNLISMNCSAQIGQSSGREFQCDLLVQTVSAQDFFLGRANQTLTIDTFVQLDLPKPSESGTVNIANRYGIRQLDDEALNVFNGPVTMDNVAVFLPNLPTNEPSGRRQLWNDNGVLKVTAAA
ncbi:MAG: hypothetical protein WA985_00185 [Erythrobacter sp.]|uniref:hypothetical protein n=1 Tax=Erythrobacter sp. TaxID=1042 RepID=UPI003C7294B7